MKEIIQNIYELSNDKPIIGLISSLDLLGINDDKNVANNIEILTTINSNFILNGTYSGNISKRDVL